MKKDNLVKLAQQVLTEIDEEMLDERDNYLRMELCNKLIKVFILEVVKKRENRRRLKERIIQ